MCKRIVQKFFSSSETCQDIQTIPYRPRWIKANNTISHETCLKFLFFFCCFSYTSYASASVAFAADFASSKFIIGDRTRIKIANLEDIHSCQMNVTRVPLAVWLNVGFIGESIQPEIRFKGSALMRCNAAAECVASALKPQFKSRYHALVCL